MDDVDLELGLLDQVPVGVVITDRKGTIARWNRAAAELFGWRAAEVLGRPVRGLATSGDDEEALLALIVRAAAGEALEGEVTLCDREGRTRCVALRMSPLYGRSSQVAGVIVALLTATSAKASARAAEVGARIAEARRDAGLTQQVLATELGVTRRSVQAYEAGAVIPYRRLDRLGELLDRAPSWLLTGLAPDGTAAAPVRELRDELRDALHEELIAVFSELGASSEQLRRAEVALIAGRRTR